MPNQAIMTACSVFLATAVLMPLMDRYKAWKAGRPEVVMRRNWRGRLVPDLTVRRLELGATLALAALFVFGLAVNFTIMLG